MIVDANVLLYAVDQTSPHHDVSRQWLEAAINGASRVGFPWQSLIAFQRIATHPRVMRRPLATAEAWAFIDDWLGCANAWIPEPGHRHQDLMRSLIVGGNLQGNIISDAHLAALAIEHGVAMVSFDSDFARFPGLQWRCPGGVLADRS
jgi:toxin-antitoxin system PIN domain toxin